MSKAVLVLDRTPTSCADCPLFYSYMDKFKEYGVCCILNIDIDDWYSKEKDCPLKPLPEKQKTSYQSDTLNVRIQWQGNTFREGWNACIDEIVGERK